jgi:hypothetical protein
MDICIAFDIHCKYLKLLVSAEIGTWPYYAVLFA